MTKKKKRYRIRWDRVLALLLFLAAVIAAIYYAVAGIISLFSGSHGTADGHTDTEAVAIDPRQLDETHLMAQRIDEFMHVPMRLDTALIAISIYDLTTQQHVYAMHQRQLLPPASCMKVPTAIAALKTLGMDHQYSTTLQVRGTMHGDTLVGNLLVKADDDPLVESFDSLTGQLHRSGIRAIRGNIYYDLAREDTLRPHPTAKTWDIAYHRTPLLLKGKSRITREFLATLRGEGISFVSDPAVRPEGKYRIVAAERHRLRDVISPMLIHSSNIKAESVLYHLDRHKRLAADRRQHWQTPHATELFLAHTFGNVAMQGFVINDGSGLSPDNRLTASFLVELLRYAYADKPLYRYLMDEALATPGDEVRHGSLLSRMSQPQYVGRIFCKTGTMTTIGASSLMGYLHGSDGHWYAFAIINTDSPVAESRIFQDRLCKLMMTAPKQ